MGICFKYKAYMTLSSCNFPWKGSWGWYWEGFLKDCLVHNHTISNASQYADLARHRNSNIDILYIIKTKVEESKPFLEDQFTNVGSYSGCSQMHCLKYYGNNIHMWETSDCTRFNVVKAFIDPNFAAEDKSNPNQEECPCEAENEYVPLEVGYWVAVDQNGYFFNGEITIITSNDNKVM